MKSLQLSTIVFFKLIPYHFVESLKHNICLLALSTNHTYQIIETVEMWNREYKEPLNTCVYC